MKKTIKWLAPLLIAVALIFILVQNKDDGKLVTIKDQELTKEEFFVEMRDKPLIDGFTYGDKILEDKIVGVLMDDLYSSKEVNERVEKKFADRMDFYDTYEEFEIALSESGMTPESVKEEIYMDELVYEAFKEHQPLTEEFIEEKYKLMVPAGKVLKIIQVQDEETAYEVIQRTEKEVENEDDFEKLVLEYSTDELSIPIGGNYTVIRDFFDPAIEEAAINLKRGEFNKEPIKTEDGYHIIMIVRDGVKGSYEEERDQLIEDEYYVRKRQYEPYNELIKDVLEDNKDKINIKDKSMDDLVDRIIN